MDQYNVGDYVQVIDYQGSDVLYDDYINRKGIIVEKVKMDGGYYRVRFPDDDQELFKSSEIKSINITLLDIVWDKIKCWFHDLFGGYKE